MLEEFLKLDGFDKLLNEFPPELPPGSLDARDEEKGRDKKVVLCQEGTYSLGGTLRKSVKALACCEAAHTCLENLRGKCGNIVYHVVHGDKLS